MSGNFTYFLAYKINSRRFVYAQTSEGYRFNFDIQQIWNTSVEWHWFFMFTFEFDMYNNSGTCIVYATCDFFCCDINAFLIMFRRYPRVISVNYAYYVEWWSNSWGLFFYCFGEDLTSQLALPHLTLTGKREEESKGSIHPLFKYNRKSEWTYLRNLFTCVVSNP